MMHRLTCLAVILSVGSVACIDTTGLVFNRDGSSATGGSTGSGMGNVTQAYRDRVMEDGPLGYWPLDEVDGGTRTPDVSGNGYDATLDNASGNGTLTFDVPGVNGATAATLENRGALYVPIPNPLSFGQTSYSLEAWVRLDSGGGMEFLSASDAGTPGFSTFYDEMFANVTHKRYSETDNETMKLDGVDFTELTHVVVVYDADRDEGFFYVDGQPILPAQPLTFSWNTNVVFTLGSAQDQASFTIDEVAVYDHMLSPESVAAHFDCADGCSE